MKQKDTNKQKKKTIFITGGCVALLIVVLLVIASQLKGRLGGGTIDGKGTRSGVYITPGITEDSSRSTITNTNLNSTKCVDDICLSHVKISCYSDKGLVEYDLTNNNSSTKSGTIYLSLGDHKAIVVYNNLAAGQTEKGYYGYDGFDLRGVTTYSISAFDEIDRPLINDGYGGSEGD